MQSSNSQAAEQQQTELGRWVSEQTYANVYGLSRQTLTNWRYRDKLAGRSEAAPGFPIYRRFGKAVRYLLAEPQPALELPDGRRKTTGQA
jgi:hypothetical protein